MNTRGYQSVVLNTMIYTLIITATVTAWLIIAL